MKNKIRVRTQRRARPTPAEVLYGADWVKRQWEAVCGMLKGRGPKDPVAWQRRIRREWERAR